MNITTSDPVVSPVIESELADWIKADSDDPMLKTCLTVATGAVINFLKQDLIARKWTLTTDTTGTVDLPYANLISIESVSVGGEEVTDYEVLEGKPYKLAMTQLLTKPNQTVINYTAGFGLTHSDVPDLIKTAIVIAAGYFYNNTGCSTQDMIEHSGAKPILIPYAVNGGIAL